MGLKALSRSMTKTKRMKNIKKIMFMLTNQQQNKWIFFSSLVVELIILAVCFALSFTDVVTDILLSVKYFNGFDHNCLKVYSNLTTVAKSSTDRPVHPGWFYLTLFFIVLPCMVRILTITTGDFYQNYFSCFHKKKKISST